MKNICMQEAKTAKNAKRELQIIERDLYHLRRAQWIFAKNMMKMGMASWVVGLLMFLFGVVVFTGFQILFNTHGVWIPLIIIAMAVPIMITAVFVHRIVVKIRRLERARKALLDKYEKAMLKKVQKMVKV
ncbi:MAG: hypothetical protein AB1305_05915 [Candidatus Hadarchaeota archaeon]